MSRIHELLAQLRASAPALAADIEREVDVLASRRAFGLNFERHTPEAVELPGRKVRAGDKVRVQPPRGEMPTVASLALYRVATIERDGDRREATLAPLGAEFEGADPGYGSRTVNVDDLVVVAEFRDPIYPGLVSTGKVERGGDKPYHAVINAECGRHERRQLLAGAARQAGCARPSTRSPRWRGRARDATLSAPSANQRAKGAFDQSSTWMKGLCQCRYSRATSAQKPSRSAFAAS